jgi:hypothetical protein
MFLNVICQNYDIKIMSHTLNEISKRFMMVYTKQVKWYCYFNGQYFKTTK